MRGGFIFRGFRFAQLPVIHTLRFPVLRTIHSQQSSKLLYNKAMRQYLTHRLNFYINLFIIALTRRFGEFLRLIGDNNHLLPHLYFHEVYALKGQNRGFQYQVGRG